MTQRWIAVFAVTITAIFVSSAASAAAVQPAGPSAGAMAGKVKKKPKKAKKRKIHVSIVGVNQNQLARDKFIKVKVRSAKRGKIKVSGKSTTFDRRGRYYGFTKVARPRFKRAGQVKVVKLRLTSGGVTAINSCEDRDIVVQAGSVKSKFRSLVRQSALCAPRPLDLSRAERCDFIVDQQAPLCMVPFPSNFYTRADTTTESGRRVHFRTDAMPRNVQGNPIDAAPYNRNDGFSQGQTIVLRVPGLDNAAALAQTNPVGLADPDRYLDPNTPVVVLNSKTGERHPIWVEIDSHASSPQTTDLLIHPMVNFDAKGRYIVILRHLKDSAGNTLEAPAGFRYYRDILPSREIVINQRRSYFEDLFRRLRNSGVPRRSLYLAWDFTVASDESNSSRALSMRDQAFAELGDTKLDDRTIPDDSTAPAFTIDSTVEDPNPQIARRVVGHVAVPCYLKNSGGAGDCGPGATMNLSEDGAPVKTGTWNAKFECIVPDAVVDAPGAEPGRPLVYGHGPMGDIGGEINAVPQRDLADDHGFVICGTDQIGMSSADNATFTNALSDLSNFPKVADRMQQGLLNELYLTRLMIHPDGLVSAPQFRVDPLDMSSDPVIDTNSSRAYYRGNGQGGILGGALTALSPDFDRVSLGVAGMNFSALLPRSALWEIYGQSFNPSYTDEEVRPLALGIAQMLWDRGESNGYAHRMTAAPLPETPVHKVLMDVAFGDHVVSNWQSNVMARTIGAGAANPFVYDGRWPGVNAQWGIEPVPGFPFDGSAIAYWDSGPVRPDPGNPGQLIGTTVPPIQNIPPILGLDPHEDPRAAETAQQMVSDFLAPSGRVTNRCAPGACYAGDFTGP